MRVLDRLEELGNPERAAFLQVFFKTGKDQYAEGDIFVGIKVPVLRRVAKQFRHTSTEDTLELLRHPWHEARLVALVLLIEKFNNGKSSEAKLIFDLYLRNKSHINNWDLVDISAPKIPGIWLLNRDRSILYELADSDSVWDRRISLLSTFAFIRENQFDDTINLCTLFLSDKEDLMHKAGGWMLREIGKRDEHVLRGFLEVYADKMPRTMLRYSIERLPEPERKYWLSIKRV